MKTNAYNQRRAPTVWNSMTLQPPSSMRPQLHSAVHQNSGLSCFHILQFVAHIKAIFPSPVAITCGRGVSCAGQCSALGAQFCPTGVGTRGRSFMIKHVVFFWPGVCSGQPGDCWHNWEDEDGEEDTETQEVTARRTSRSATLPSWVTKYQFLF